MFSRACDLLCPLETAEYSAGLRRDAFLGQIGIGAAVEQQLDDLDVTPGGGVLQGRTPTYTTYSETRLARDGSWSSSSRTRSRSPMAAVQIASRPGTRGAGGLRRSEVESFGTSASRDNCSHRW